MFYPRVRSTRQSEIEGGEELYVSGPIPLSSPVLARFRTTAELAVGDPGQPATPMNAVDEEERRAIERFFEACSGA